MDRDVSETGQLRVAVVRDRQSQHVHVRALSVDVGRRVEDTTRGDAEEVSLALDDVDEAELELCVGPDVGVGGVDCADLRTRTRGPFQYDKEVLRKIQP